MVLFVDLDDEESGSDHLDPRHHSLQHGSNSHEAEAPGDERPNPNRNGFAAILSCYPIVTSLAGHLDLNSLHDLSRTCRQFRANLLQCRKQLIAQSLRCSKEHEDLSSSLADRLREARLAWRTNGGSSYAGRITSGKVGKCARDLVAECRNCGTVVCRNCTAKPPPSLDTALRSRHRRLCRTCIKAPLSLHTSLGTLHYNEAGATLSPSSSPSSSPARLHRFPTPTAEPGQVDTEDAFTASAFLRDSCNCADIFWLCQDCGRGLRPADLDYSRGWTWRKSYSTYLGGLGTGIGEGSEGVHCGRRGACLAAKIVEQEVDCDADALRAMEEEAEKIASQGTGRNWQGTSFEIQEIDGIGGVVKKKIKKLIPVGASVVEKEDERDGSRAYLDREVRGEVRSWCSWCERVIPSKEE
ncbi:hypothetical protein FKW77_010164 [Venturia effusa]|uniref:F-box domain-containing protein n=1 Tax=Venturia effusa TaxID=50376 RepID=A0A517L4G8_9PEZI|nr:hypothetical protein FKW77_010164 [Venturia effusa]